MGFLDGLEKLINEHGSASILKERIALANDKYAAIEAKLSASELRVKNLESENEALRLNNDQLKQQNGALEEKSSHVQPLKFDEFTGTYIDANSPLRYCQVCRDAHNRPTPLRNDTHGWYCQICKRHFDDPDRPRPPITFGGPLA